MSSFLLETARARRSRRDDRGHDALHAALRLPRPSLAAREVAPLYAEWVKTYADPGFEALAVRLEATARPARHRQPAVRANYRRAMELEYGFFDANV